MAPRGCAVVPARFMPAGLIRRSPCQMTGKGEIRRNQSIQGKPADPAHAPRGSHMGQFGAESKRFLVQRSNLREIRLVPGEEGIDIAVTVNDVHDLECIAFIAKKDDMALVSKAADVGSEFGARPPDHTGQACQFAALPAQVAHQPQPGCDAAALMSNEFEDVDKVRLRRTQPAKLRHSADLAFQFLGLGQKSGV